MLTIEPHDLGDAPRALRVRSAPAARRVSGPTATRRHVAAATSQSARARKRARESHRVPAAHAMRLAGALASACTLRGRSGNMTARGRGATHATSRAGVADTERARRVAEVVQLDGEHFGGDLLGLERALGCSRETDESGLSSHG